MRIKTIALTALLSGLFALWTPVTFAALVVEGAVDTPETAIGATHEANVPTGVQAGELLVYCYIGTEINDFLVLSGWTDVSGNAGGGERTGCIYREAVGTESGTITFSNDDGSAGYGGVMFRVSGFDTSTPFNSNNQHGDNATENPFVLAAGTLTGASTDSMIIHLWGSKTATRTISSLDADLTLIDSAEGGDSGFAAHVAYETGATQNSAISTTMNDSRDWAWGLWEIQAAAGGGTSIVPIIQQHSRRRGN